MYAYLTVWGKNIDSMSKGWIVKPFAPLCSVINGVKNINLFFQVADTAFGSQLSTKWVSFQLQLLFKEKPH